MGFYRLSSLLRGYDLGLGTNRLILLLTALGAVAGAASGLMAVGRRPSAIVLSAVLAAVTVFAAAALAKELDPDHPASAVLAAVLGLPAAWVALPESLPALLWLLLVLRFINRATGLAPKLTDTLALLLLGGALTWFGSPLFGVLTGAMLLLDALLPDGRRAHSLLGLLAIVGAGVYWVLNVARYAPQPHETWLGVLLLAVAIATIGVILACYVILMPCDATGRPLDSARFQAAQVVALAVGLSFASWHGYFGAALFVALWVALLGAVVVHWFNAATRRAPAST